MKAKSAERVHDNTPVSDRLNLSNAAVRMFAARPVLALDWTGLRTHSRDYVRQTEDYEPRELLPSRAALVALVASAGRPETIPMLGREPTRPAPESVRAGVAA